MRNQLLIISLSVAFLLISTATATAPVANFSANKISGAAPLTVSFSDLSSNIPTGWAWYFGDEPYNAYWAKINASAGWTYREQFPSVVLPDGSIVLMGGNVLGGYGNDTWRSTDNGATWTQITAHAEWPARFKHTSVVMPDGSIILMGGEVPGVAGNDVWRSTNNGTNWTQVNSVYRWSARKSHTSVAMPDGGLVVMGGIDGIGQIYNDAWWSPDNGVTWTKMNESSGWSARYSHSSIVAPDGSILLMGGGTNDVWRSTDNGATWTLVNASAGWNKRTQQNVVVMPDGSIVLIGGDCPSFSGTCGNDLWRSIDNGTTWSQMKTSAEWAHKSAPSVVVMPNGNIVVMGGWYPSQFAYSNDVWRLITSGASVQNPSHTFTKPGIYTVTLQAFNADGYNNTRKTAYINVTQPLTPSKIGVVRNSNTWLLDSSGNGAYGAGDLAYSFGKSGDVFIAGDWNNNGKTEIGVVRNGISWLLDSSGDGKFGVGDLSYTFGKVGDVYVSGDWNADGKTEIGVVRNGMSWLLDASGDGKYGVGDLSYTFGKVGDVPVTGDWNNDRKTEIGVVRNGNMWLLDASGNGGYGAGDLAYTFGKVGDVPVTGDWNADSKTEIGVFRNSNTWLLDASGDGKYGAGDLAYTFGKAGDQPVTGKWS